MNNKFVHLHTHTEYSLLDGTNKIKDYVKKVKQLGMTAAAITDHGNMYGVISFINECEKEGIKPIIGCEVYVAPGSRFEKDNDNRYYHLVLLAENIQGYYNLVKLVSLAYKEGYYYNPRVDEELLRKYHEGIIASSACIAGEFAKAAVESIEKAKEVARKYEDIFGKGNFYLELQDHMDGSKEQQITNNAVLTVSKELGIPVIATNDVHYTNKEDAKAHEIALCMQSGKKLSEPHMVYAGGQYYVKSEEEMLALFPYAKEAVYETGKVAERCNVKLEFGNYKIPQYELPEGYASPKDYLFALTKEGFERKFAHAEGYEGNEELLKELWEETVDELAVIDKMGFNEYLLIVWDYINWSRTHDCWVGPGRGSAAGSKVCYCIGITNVDPVKYGLLFERFLNPERVSMPDIDVDFEYSERQRVIDDYICKKYGENNVSQITTFQTMAAKAVLKDVGRVLDIPYSETNRISKLVPNELNITLKKALELNPELKEYAESSEDIRKWFEYSMALEGLPKATSLHAAGVVIYPSEADECMPQAKSPDSAQACQYNMVQLESLGYLKMDFLGLRTLTVEKDAISNVKKTKGIDIDVDKIPLNDKKVLDFIGTGKTNGVFQLESQGMQNFMKELKPQDFEDIIAGISLYRPGPMDTIPDYIEGKNSQSNIRYAAPQLESILKATYGCIVYQEQVMQIVRDLAGYSMGAADNIRRAMSKKKQYVIDEEREYFVHGNKERNIKGCVANGISEQVANEIYDKMVDFAKYAFNKSHAAAYAVISMQTAYLKYYYPAEYMAALCTSVIGKAVKLAEYMQATKAYGIEILPPDINKSGARFEVEDGKIRFALSGIQGVSSDVAALIEKDREENGPFKNYSNVVERLQALGVKSNALVNIAKAGAFSCFGGKRSQYVVASETAIKEVSAELKKNVAGQMSIFELMGEEETEKISLPPINEYPLEVLYSLEKEATGVYITGHPLEGYMPLIKANCKYSSADFLRDEETGAVAFTEDQKATVGGIINAVRIIYTKKNQQMAFVTLEDITGTVDVIVFPKTYEKYYKILKEGNMVVIEGLTSVEDDKDVSVKAEKVTLFKDVPRMVWLKMTEDKYEEQREYFENLKKMSIDNTYDLIVYLSDLKMKKVFPRCANEDTLYYFQNSFGEENVAITY